MRFLLAPFISCLVAFSAQAAGDPPRTPVPPLVAVPSLDVERYMGTWYEIAKYPNRFQRQCVADTRAEYSQMPDGRVRVINRCRLESGEFESADGVARLVGGTGSPKLEVRFAPAWLSFIPSTSMTPTGWSRSASRGHPRSTRRAMRPCSAAWARWDSISTGSKPLHKATGWRPCAERTGKDMQLARSHYRASQNKATRRTDSATAKT